MRERHTPASRLLVLLAPAIAAAGAFSCASSPKTHLAETIPTSHGTGEAAIRTSAEARLAFKEVKGPYTEIGPAVEEMWAYALSVGIERPVIRVIYYDDPETVDPRVARSDVGFEVPVAVAPRLDSSPYRTRVVPSMRIATLTVKGPPTTTWECYGTLERWASSRGAEVDRGAPVHETYVGSPGTPLAEFEVEIAMPLAGERPRS